MNMPDPSASAFHSVKKEFEKELLAEEGAHNAPPLPEDFDSFLLRDLKDFPLNTLAKTSSLNMSFGDIATSLKQQQLLPADGHSYEKMSEQQLREVHDSSFREMQARGMPIEKPLLSKKLIFNCQIVEKEWADNRTGPGGDLHAGKSNYEGTPRRYGGHLMSLRNYKSLSGEYACPMCKEFVPLNANGKRAKDKQGMCKECARGCWQHHKDGWTFKWCSGCHKWEHVSFFSPINASKCQSQLKISAADKRGRDSKKRVETGVVKREVKPQVKPEANQVMQRRKRSRTSRSQSLNIHVAI
jgi:hypothetical protein